MRLRLGLLAVLGLSGSAEAIDLSVSVEGLRSRAGQVAVCVFREAPGFPDCAKSRSALRRTVAAGEAGRALVFRGLGPGPYAVTVLHDENGNGRLDTNLLGIPKEGVGISNNRLPRFSAPAFTDARFELPAGRRQRVRVTYW